jgi:hypothetical protein
MTKRDGEPKLIFETEEPHQWGLSYVDGTPVTDPHWDARVTGVEVLTGTIVHLKFADGFEGPFDLKLLMKGPIFERVFELGEFNAVHLEYSTIAWPSGADIAPETLRYEAARYKVPEQVLAGFEAALNVASDYANSFGRTIAANAAQSDGARRVATQLFTIYTLLRGIKLGSEEFEAVYTAFLRRGR